MLARSSPEHSTWAGLVGWVGFDWAAQPFYTLVLTFLFAPYFASTFIADAALGQEIWAYATAITGFIVAFLSPIIGAIADASGARKPWIALASLFLLAGLAALWLAEPGNRTMLWPVVLAVVVAGVAAETATVFTNAMMPGLVPHHQLGRLSGFGWAVGYAGGLVSLVLTAGFLVADGETGKTMLGMRPVLPLDTLSHEGDRLVGPFCALWYTLFVLPLFLFTPDHVPGPKVRGLGAATRQGMGQLRTSLSHLGRYANIVRFLFARMLYADGLGAIFAFGGLYASAVFGWSATELGVFGVILTVAASVGAVLGGPLDDRLGARTLILFGLVGLLVACAGVLSVDSAHVLYVVEVEPASRAAGLFSSTGEKIYLLFSMGIGLVAGPVQAASRSLMARLSPPEMMTEFFGLFAFSGKVTAFAAPLAVGIVTGLTGDQRLGIAAIAVFLVAGFLLLLTVREEG
jgi:UMF1 family MFS transporter